MCTGSQLIPLVDVGGLTSSRSENENLLKEKAKEITDAFSTIGFVYLLNHGIPGSQVRASARQGRSNFIVPQFLCGCQFGL